jgi:hypothetical protein
LNLFNAALVTPTYYVYFTSSTIITSAILFRGFKGTPTSIITVVMGFFVICAGVVLLQLSKSAKDVPDTAVFAGNLDQVRTIAEQEQPESEPKADAIRGTAAIVRRFSTARQKMELSEARRLHEEKLQDLQPIGENEHIEWDGLRRRRTTFGTHSSVRSGENSTPFPRFETGVQTPQAHPPLGMSRFPEDTDSDQEEGRPNTGGLSSFIGSIRSHARSAIVPGQARSPGGGALNVHSPMHPVPLTEISIPVYGSYDGVHFGHGHERSNAYNLPPGQKTEYEGAAGERERHITIIDDGAPQRMGSSSSSLRPSLGPTPPPHFAKRQFSFQNVFKKAQTSVEDNVPQNRSPMIRKALGARKTSHGAQAKGATEEERLGLVKGDTATGRHATMPDYDEEEGHYDDEDGDWTDEDKVRHRQMSEQGHRRDLTPPRRETKEKEREVETESTEVYNEKQRRKWEAQSREPPPPPFDDRNGDGAFL